MRFTKDGNVVWGFFFVFWVIIGVGCEGTKPPTESSVERTQEPQVGNEKASEQILDASSEAQIPDEPASSELSLDASDGSPIEKEPSPETPVETSVEATPDGTKPSDGTWTSLPDLPFGPLQEVAVVSLGQKIYILGGIDEKKRTVDSVHIYDTQQKAWSVGAKLPFAMHHVNAAVVGDKIYVLGALLQSFLETDGIYVYDPAKDTWTPDGTMPQGKARGASGVGVIDGKIYVAGGFRGFKAVADFSVYDPTTKTWADLPSLTQVRDHMAVGVVGGIFYLAGGRDTQISSHNASFSSFDPSVGRWVDLPDMPTSRGGTAAAVCAGRLYIFGGEGNPNATSQVFDQIEVYDPALGAWFSLPPMKTPRHGTAAVTLGNQVFIPGGATTIAFGAAATFESFDCTKP
ncbi:MAG: kelch repeat-containing protein [Myxococcales bacterium]|nr:kelch repeat-containing protein [Myxococcales bacterium]